MIDYRLRASHQTARAKHKIPETSAGQPAPLPRLKAKKAAATPKNTTPVMANTIAGSLVIFGGVGCISILFTPREKKAVAEERWQMLRAPLTRALTGGDNQT
jgi:hypothetical protein